ncbi:SAP30-binding protein-like [Penaeus indicus]|uniref:SAP30-binding protein-like n=1 Tax=Penaeus indicus TaxID=29960 RepID=UPI00300D563D
MSLGQLTANYTDSEGENDDRISDDGSHKSSPLTSRVAELRDEGSRRGTPASVESTGSGTPQKKLASQVIVENQNGSLKYDVFGLKGWVTVHQLLLMPPKLATSRLPACYQEKVQRFLNEVRRGNKDYNMMIQNNKEFRNPGIYEKLIDLLQLDEMGTNYPLDMFDPHCWGKESYYDEIARVQKEEMDRREKERKDKTKVDIISGTKKPQEEEAKKRKSRFDQGGPSTNILKPMVAPPTLTSVPSGTKATIDAFGGLKKTK